MAEDIKIITVEDKILILRNQRVILDKDVAKLYGVDTKRVNEAVRNNSDKFPDGYVFEITEEERIFLRSKNSTLEKGGRGTHSKYLAKAFTEKGLYMLATILKSKVATETTLAIIETFAKVRELSATVAKIADTEDKAEQEELIKKGGMAISDLISSPMVVSDTETTIEVNFAMLKLKHTIKRKNK